MIARLRWAILFFGLLSLRVGVAEGLLGLDDGDDDADGDEAGPVEGLGLVRNMVGGAVGMDLKNVTVIRLRKGSVLTELEEVDCVETMFMSPYHVDVYFSLNSTFLRSRHNSTCRWMFIGTEPCIPMLSCEDFNLNCEDEYLEVYDGNRGLKRFCGSEKPLEVVANDDLRDLYVKYMKVNKNNNKQSQQSSRAGGSYSSSYAGEPDKFRCTVSCSKRGSGKPLPTTFTPTINPLCTCGGRPKSDRIVGGEVANRLEFPWIVALVEARTRQPFCGGSLINDRIILTAGHCFKGSFLDVHNFEILVGAQVLDTTPNTMNVKTKPLAKTYDNVTLERLDRENGTFRLIPEEYFVHPLYIPETNDYDVGAILLSEPFKFEGTKINPVCLPELGSYLRTFARKKGTIAGWGLQNLTAPGTPTLLQKVNVTVFSPKECKEMYAHRVNRRMLCAGYREGGRDSCSGDSGGPLVTEDRKEVWVQMGSVSWGDGCANQQSPGVYFRTTESGQWLNYHSNVNGAVWCAVPQ